MEPIDQFPVPGLAESSTSKAINDCVPGSLLEKKEKQLKEVQDQIESYNKMVKVLASQREAAVKVLHDMDSKIATLTKELEMERIKVEAKDKELRLKRTQLQKLKDEESSLQKKFSQAKTELNLTVDNLNNTQLNETQVRDKIQELREFLTTTNATIDEIEKAISINDTMRLGTLCKQPPLTPPPLSINSLLTNGFNVDSGKQLKENQAAPTGDLSTILPKDDNENSNSMFDSATNFDPFENEDPFEGDDPFNLNSKTNLPLPDDDPFNPTSATTSSSNRHIW